MNCPHCGSDMVFKKIYDYGGYSMGWECIFCKTVVNPIQAGRKTGFRKDQVLRRPGEASGWN
jgi:hypothetical protein